MGITRRFYSKDRVQIVATLAYAIFERGMRLRSHLAACFVLEGLVIGLGMSGPYALKVLIDGLTQNTVDAFLAGGLVLIFIAGSLGGGILGSWRRIYSQRIIDRLNTEIVDDALKVAMPELAARRSSDTGHVLGLIERLPFSLQVLIEGLMWQIVPTGIQVAISLVIIADLLRPVYVAVLGGTVVAYAASTWFGAVQQQAVSAEVSATSGQLSQTVADILRNARRVVLNGALDTERRLVRDQFDNRADAFGGMLSSQVIIGLLQYGVAGAGLSALLVLGAKDVLEGNLTVGGFLLLQAYAFRLVLPLSGFGFLISQAALALITVREALDLGKGEPDLNAPTAVSALVGAASVNLQKVAFSYGLGLSGLSGISVNLAAGSFTVIVGPNGSGKSTLAQLMAGILVPAVGEVIIGSIPLQSIPPSLRHRYLLYVPQTVSLLNRSLLANATYPPTSQTESELARLLTEWRFYDPARPIDFGAAVGEQGEHLSGGQRQKLELARLARVRVPVLILDESTSALDPASEAEIIKTLRDNYEGHTTLVLITHRVELAEMADQVIFLKNGTIIRSGTHADLMTDSAAYARLWQNGKGVGR